MPNRIRHTDQARALLFHTREVNEIPGHHKLEEYLRAYIKTPDIAEDRKGRCSAP